MSVLLLILAVSAGVPFAYLLGVEVGRAKAHQ